MYLAAQWLWKRIRLYAHTGGHSGANPGEWHSRDNSFDIIYTAAWDCAES